MTIYDYSHRISSFPAAKIEKDAGFSFTEIWRKMNLPVISSQAREVLYLAVHNKLTVGERLFRVGLINDPYCSHCLSLQGATVHDMKNFFSSCVIVIAT